MPKGIYRPQGWRHVLSIKVMPGGRYADEESVSDDGGLRLQYHQEEPRNADPLRYFTNAGLRNCLSDGVPIGVIRQLKPKPNPKYEILGLGRVVAWRPPFFTIDLPPAVDVSPPTGETPPISLEDARKRALQEVVRRQGQANFRRALLAAYAGRCVISGCDVSETLEAAHIKPYLGEHTNQVRNGLLLRADLHTLFDLRLIRIHPQDLTVVLDPSLHESEYRGLNGKRLRLPTSPLDAPAADALAYQWSTAGEQEAADTVELD